MGKVFSILVFLFLSININAETKPDLFLELFSSDYSDPLAVRNDGINHHLYIVQRNGEIYISDSNGTKNTVPFLDIDSKISSGGEGGLLGLAFHPDYKSNRLFVVNYTRISDGATVIATYKALENDIMIADPNSEKILLTISQPYSNHNGGDIHFAKDGYLYIGTGDGGSGGDPQNYAQNYQSLLGKMLRIHLDSDSTYTIPSDNPFYNDFNAKGEIWNTGLRNPWRFSFDRLTDDLWIADVGQNALEEVNLAQSPRVGGENYGWRCYEGNQSYNSSGCGNEGNYTSPVFTYGRSNESGGRSITGGYVYRGTDFQDLYGYYVCADYVSGSFWLLRENQGEMESIFKRSVLSNVTSFGEDIKGEMYACSFDGNIYKVGSVCSDLQIDSTQIELITCPSDQNGSIEIFLSNSIDNYEILWSNGLTQSNISGLGEGWYQVEVKDSKGCFLKHSFEIYSTVEIPVITLAGDSLLTDANGTYQWYENGSPLDTAQDSYIIPQQGGLYQVEVTDSEGCKLLSEVFELNINSLKGNNLIETFQVYPNPTTDLVTMKFSQNLKIENGTLRVFDLNGRVVLEELNKNISSPISLSSLALGLYFIGFSIEETGFRGVSKVTKMNN